MAVLPHKSPHGDTPHMVQSCSPPCSHRHNLPTECRAIAAAEMSSLTKGSMHQPLEKSILVQGRRNTILHRQLGNPSRSRGGQPALELEGSSCSARMPCRTMLTRPTSAVTTDTLGFLPDGSCTSPGLSWLRGDRSTWKSEKNNH